MFFMGQDQSDGMGLENKVVGTQSFGVAEDMKLPPI